MQTLVLAEAEEEEGVAGGVMDVVADINLSSIFRCLCISFSNEMTDLFMWL